MIDNARPTIRFPISELRSLAVFCAELFKQGIHFQVDRFDDETFVVTFYGY